MGLSDNKVRHSPETFLKTTGSIIYQAPGKVRLYDKCISYLYRKNPPKLKANFPGGGGEEIEGGRTV